MRVAAIAKKQPAGRLLAKLAVRPRLIPLERDHDSGSLWAESTAVERQLIQSGGRGQQPVARPVPVTPISLSRPVHGGQSARAPRRLSVSSSSSTVALTMAIAELQAIRTAALASSSRTSASPSTVSLPMTSGSTMTPPLGSEFIPTGARLVVPPSSDDDFLTESASERCSAVTATDYASMRFSPASVVIEADRAASQS